MAARSQYTVLIGIGSGSFLPLISRFDLEDALTWYDMISPRMVLADTLQTALYSTR